MRARVHLSYAIYSPCLFSQFYTLYYLNLQTYLDDCLVWEWAGNHLPQAWFGSRWTWHYTFLHRLRGRKDSGIGRAELSTKGIWVIREGDKEVVRKA